MCTLQQYTKLNHLSTAGPNLGEKPAKARNRRAAGAEVERCENRSADAGGVWEGQVFSADD